MKTKFFTGEGDGGKSRIGDKNFSKSSALMELLGSLDELNSWLGLCRVIARKSFETQPPTIDLNMKSSLPSLDVADVLKNIQNSLFIIQAEIATLGFGYKKGPQIQEEKTRELEAIIVEVDKVVPKLEKFIIVGGTELSAHLDIGRAIARRVERLANKYSLKKQLREPLLKFLNRLSSVLFVLARYVNYRSGFKEEHPTY